jgi:hypothetical protein
MSAQCSQAHGFQQRKHPTHTNAGHDGSVCNSSICICTCIVALLDSEDGSTEGDQLLSSRAAQFQRVPRIAHCTQRPMQIVGLGSMRRAHTRM